MSGVRTGSGDEDLVRTYLTDIGQYPLLTKDDEVRLAKLIQSGVDAAARLEDGGKLTAAEKRKLVAAVKRGEQANQDFVHANLRLVVSIAKNYQASGLPLLDLIQEGNLGLMHAVEKFDHTKGFKFSTYATWWIRQAISRGIANTSRTIRLPVHAGDAAKKVGKTQNQMEARLGRPPTLTELAQELQMPEEKLVEILLYQADPVSFSKALGDEGDSEFGDMIADPMATTPFEATAINLLSADIERMLRPLSDKERDIISLRFGLDRGETRTLDEVGELYDLSRERIRQIEQRAMSKLRHPAADTGARDLLNF